MLQFSLTKVFAKCDLSNSFLQRKLSNDIYQLVIEQKDRILNYMVKNIILYIDFREMSMLNQW